MEGPIASTRTPEFGRMKLDPNKFGIPLSFIFLLGLSGCTRKLLVPPDGYEMMELRPGAEIVLIDTLGRRHPVVFVRSTKDSLIAIPSSFSNAELAEVEIGRRRDAPNLNPLFKAFGNTLIEPELLLLYLMVGLAIYLGLS